MFQFRITRTGSLAPSVRQRESRKSKKSVKKPRDAFEFFKQKRKSDRHSRVSLEFAYRYLNTTQVQHENENKIKINSLVVQAEIFEHHK